MAEKFNSDTDLTSEELASHLRQPNGEIGKQIGLQMNKSNKSICLNSYNLLNPVSGDHILEIGMGNGFFIRDLMLMEYELSYTGVDYSPTMIQEAIHLNKDLVESGTVRFEYASIEKLPFADNSFDCITTTNTLYFWPKAEENANELLRVLKPGGKLLIAYRSRSCMDQIELARHGFTKYDIVDVENLLTKSYYKQVSTRVIKEPDLEFDGKVVEMESIFTSGFK